MKAFHEGDGAVEGPHINSAVHVEAGLNITEDGDLEHPEMRLRSLLEHFSMYALDASEGHIGEGRRYYCYHLDWTAYAVLFYVLFYVQCGATMGQT